VKEKEKEVEGEGVVDKRKREDECVRLRLKIVERVGSRVKMGVGERETLMLLERVSRKLAVIESKNEKEM